MKWIEYKVVQSIIDEEVICIDKKVGYNEENLAIAQEEAYDGEYEITEDEESNEVEPLSVELGGTGAKTAEGAREKLGITPKGIGVPTTEEFNEAMKNTIPPVGGATEGHIPVFDANGKLVSSGVSMWGHNRATFTLSGTVLYIQTVT